MTVHGTHLPSQTEQQSPSQKEKKKMLMPRHIAKVRNTGNKDKNSQIFLTAKISRIRRIIYQMTKGRALT
jgi:hypothetical protein